MAARRLSGSADALLDKLVRVRTEIADRYGGRIQPVGQLDIEDAEEWPDSSR